MSVCGAVARCVECGKCCLPVGVVRGANVLEWFERYRGPAVVLALHACQPSGKPLRDKGVAGGGYLGLARLGASKGNMPPIGAQHDPSVFSFCLHRHSPSCVTDASRCGSREPSQ